MGATRLVQNNPRPRHAAMVDIARAAFIGDRAFHELVVS